MTIQKNNPIISIAPMIRYTDRHYRQLMRAITKHTQLYTEMVVTGFLLYGRRQQELKLDPNEQLTALQLAGSHPKDLANCAKIAEDLGYCEVNLNIGCPSERVQAGEFGACLMKKPELVAECVAAMQNAVTIPITVKTRIGVDDQDSYEALQHFIALNAQAGCTTFIIHARKAWLNGLSPRENREIPPLKYETVYQLKRDFSNLKIIINGGIKTIPDIETHLKYVDGAMIGREAYDNPFLFAQIENHFFTSNNITAVRKSIVQEYFEYILKKTAEGVPIHHLTRHLLSLFHAEPHAKQWRKLLSVEMLKQSNKIVFLQKMIEEIN